MSETRDWGPNGLTLAAIRVRQSRPETARYDIGVLLVGLDATEQRCRELETVLREVYRHHPVGNIRDWIAEVLGLASPTEDEE